MKETYRWVGPDGTEWSVEYDTALWVETDGKRGYLAGNAHLGPGRFKVYFPDQGYRRTVKFGEFTAMSAEARFWLAGFLAGSEPDIDEYLGRRIDEHAFDPMDVFDPMHVFDPMDEYYPTVEEWIRWKNFNERYRRVGNHIYLPKRPDRAIFLTDEQRAEIHLDHWQPWTYVGERVLIPNGVEWVEADPQPEMDGPWLAGSVCAARNHELIWWLENGWEVCKYCGAVEDKR